MTPPVLTLTTDFGLSDHYTGAMKGVILGICPDARIVDISHQVAPFAIGEGAYTIAQAWPCFPPRTVHVVVVDPGVGSSRRPILVETAGHYFIGPDNGVLAMVYLRQPAKVRLISNEHLYRQPVSRTFHGRDIFAPVAARLAAGLSPSHVGDVIENYLKPDFVKPHRAGKRTWLGQILKIDHFGNIITNFHVDDFGDLATRNFQMEFGPVAVNVLARNYSETGPGEPFVILGSAGYYEVSLAQGSAAAKIKCQTGAAIELLVW